MIIDKMAKLTINTLDSYYTKTISWDVYSKWKCYNVWHDYYEAQHDPCKFLLDEYANYLHKVEWASLTDMDNVDMIFTFKSEADYTWFLLHQ